MVIVAPVWGAASEQRFHVRTADICPNSSLAGPREQCQAVAVPDAEPRYGTWRGQQGRGLGAPVELVAAGHPVEISSPNKPMFPEPGVSKLDLARYYLAVETPIMRTVRDRPTLLQRFPNGVTGSNFFQKRIPDSAPDWLQTTIVSTPNGTTSRAIVMADIAHVLWAANLGCLGFHPWPYRADDPTTPTSCASTSIPPPA